MEEESILERQENEFQLLQAIFMDDLSDLRKKRAWRQWCPLELFIRLHPQQSISDQKDVHVSIDLHVKCSEEYPNRIPIISLKNSKGLSKSQSEDLRKQLLNLANGHKGEVMILELAQHVQKFLHVHNKPGFESFYDQMLQNQRLHKEQIVQEQLRKQEFELKEQDLQRKSLEEEIMRKQEALRKEKHRSRTSSKRTDSEESIERKSNENSQNETHKQKSKIVCNHQTLTTLSFDHGKDNRKVERGQCLGHGKRGVVTYAGLDCDSGQLVTIVEWAVPHQAIKKAMLEELSRQILCLEQELSTLVRIGEGHRGLVKYLGMHHSTGGDSFCVCLFEEHVRGTPLSSFLDIGIPLEASLLQHYIKELLEILMYLHDLDVVHKDLRASSVFSESSGMIRLADYSLDKKLSDWYNNAQRELEEHSTKPTISKTNKKCDIFKLGLLTLSLSLGKSILDELPVIPRGLPKDLQDFLQKCLCPKEQDRWTTGQLLNHPFLKLSLTQFHTPQKPISLEEDKNLNDPELSDSANPALFVPYFNIGDGYGRSRLYEEFEIISFLGSGGFGDVLKARNKLDGRLYAIKRILLNPSKQQLNRKVMREVKLLSRLNHENVVRYYNSWIETTNKCYSSVDSEISTNSAKTIPSECHKDSKDLELLAPPKIDGSLDWGVSYDLSSARANCPMYSSSSDEEDDEDLFGSSFLRHIGSSESIIFEIDEVEQKKECQELSSFAKEDVLLKNVETKSIQFMYIQMEFCEKSTLRIAIAEGLHKEIDRMWRLFREIVEGLVHIHNQGMIHRDLKPVNIFLDYNDHVKIGDFGLATTDIVPKSSVTDRSSAIDLPNDASELSDLLGTESLTGRVGTALYVAPELLAPTNCKTSYNQKVDIYSLGIIFFEMCYPTPSTGMERIKLISQLRQPEIKFPNDSEKQLTEQQVHFIRWLLQHELSERPTSEELLASPELPPPQLEEAELDEMLRHTVSNPQSRAYKRMVGALFRQSATPAIDFTYDLDTQKALPLAGGVGRSLSAYNATTNSLERILQKHGALKISVPTLMPKLWNFDKNELSVQLMDHGGGIVTLPNNLRVSFARFVARRDIAYLKRYAIEKIYRERKVYGSHPREFQQCTFDIIHPSGNSLLPDAEILALVSEVISEFPVLQSRNYTLCINHMELLKALLINCGIEELKHKDVMLSLAEFRKKSSSKGEMHDRLTEIGISETIISSLFQWVDLEEPLHKAEQAFKAITKRRFQASTLINQIIRELQAIVKHAEEMGFKLPVVIVPAFVSGLQIYSGIIFQFVCEITNKKRANKSKMEVLAVGGRYDALISSFRMTPSRDKISQSGVGVSIALDKVAATQFECKELSPLHDVALCSVGQSQMLHEKCFILKGLWAAGVSTHIVYDSSMSLEEICVFCKENFISHLLILKENDSAQVKVRAFEKDRFMEKKVQLSDIVDYVVKLCVLKSDPNEFSQQSRLETCRSSTSLDEKGSGPDVHTVFVHSEKMDKISSIGKRKLEGLIRSNLSNSLSCFSNRSNINILVVDINSTAIKTIASLLEINLGESTFETSVSNIMERLPRHKYLSKILDAIHELLYEKGCSIFILYSFQDNSYKIIL